MVLVTTAGPAVTIRTGLALHTGGARAERWRMSAFGQVLTLAGDSRTRHILRRPGLRAIGVLVPVNVAAAVRRVASLELFPDVLILPHWKCSQRKLRRRA